MDLVKEDIIRDLLGDLDSFHLAVVALRSGLVDGLEVPVCEVAEQLDATTKEIERGRAEATKLIKARQKEVYPFADFLMATSA